MEACRGAAAGGSPGFHLPSPTLEPEGTIEIFLDRSNPLHWVAAAVLFVSGAATLWLGVRDGFVRRRVVTSSGVFTGARAIATGVVYAAFGLAGVVGGVLFLLKGS